MLKDENNRYRDEVLGPSCLGEENQSVAANNRNVDTKQGKEHQGRDERRQEDADGRNRRDHLKIPEPVNTPAVAEEVHPPHELLKPPLLVVVDDGLRRVNDRAELLEPGIQFSVLVDGETDIKPPDRYDILLPVDAIAAADALDNSLPLEHPVLYRVGTPKEGVEGEGNRLLPEPCADVPDSSSHAHDTVVKLADQVFKPVFPGDAICIGEGDVVSPGMLDTNLAGTADGPVILVHHGHRVLSGNLHGGIGGVPVYDNDLIGLQGLLEEGLKASRDLGYPVANRNHHRYFWD